MKKKSSFYILLLMLCVVFMLTSCTNESDVIKKVGKSTSIDERIVDIEGVLENAEKTALIAYDLKTHETSKLYTNGAEQTNFVAGELSSDKSKILLGRNVAAPQTYAYSILDLKKQKLINYETVPFGYQNNDESAGSIGVIGFGGTGFWLNNDTIANMGVNIINDLHTKKAYNTILPKGRVFAGFAVAADQDKNILFHIDETNPPFQPVLSDISYSIYNNQGELIETHETNIKQNYGIVSGEIKKNFLVIASYTSEHADKLDDINSTISFIDINSNNIVSKNGGFATYSLDSQGNYFAGIAMQSENSHNTYKDSEGDWLVIYNSSGEKIKGWECPFDDTANMIFTRVFWSNDNNIIYVLGFNHDSKQSTLWQVDLNGNGSPKEVTNIPYFTQYVGINDDNTLYLLVGNQ